MGCICTEPRTKPSNLDILKESGEPETITQNEQKPDKHSNQEIPCENCAPSLRDEEVDNKSTTRPSETYLLDSKVESDLSSLTPETTSDDMKQNVVDFNLVYEEAVTLEQCTPGENRSTKLQWDRVVVSQVSMTDLKALESAKASSAELAKATLKLEHMESKNKEKDEEIQNLKAENCRLKENAKSKAAQIALKSFSLKKRHSVMRKRREEIEKSTGISHKLLPNLQSFSEEEQEHAVEPRISITQVPKLDEISPKIESSIHWRPTPREKRPPKELVETESKWTFFEPIVLQ